MTLTQTPMQASLYKMVFPPHRNTCTHSIQKHSAGVIRHLILLLVFVKGCSRHRRLMASVYRSSRSSGGSTGQGGPKSSLEMFTAQGRLGVGLDADGVCFEMQYWYCLPLLSLVPSPKPLLEYGMGSLDCRRLQQQREREAGRMLELESQEEMLRSVCCSIASADYVLLVIVVSAKGWLGCGRARPALSNAPSSGWCK